MIIFCSVKFNNKLNHTLESIGMELVISWGARLHNNISSQLRDSSSIPIFIISCGFNLLLVILTLRQELIFLSGFPPSTKTNTYKFQFDLDRKS